MAAKTDEWMNELPQKLLPQQAHYLSKLRRDSVGADFQSVRKLTNYICAKPPESRLSHISKVS